MTRELVLHVGPAKTGTTTLQHAMAANRDGLLASGIFFPIADGTSPGQHTPILREVIGDRLYEAHCAWSRDELSLEQSLDQWERSSAPRMLLSSENLFTTSDDWLGDLLGVVAPDTCLLVAGIPSPLHWSRSWQGQSIKAGLTSDCTDSADEFLRSFVSLQLGPILDSIRRHRAGTPPMRLHLFAVPEAPDGSLELTFSEAIGLPSPLPRQSPLNQHEDLCLTSTVLAANVVMAPAYASMTTRAHRQHWVRAALAEAWETHEWHRSNGCGSPAAPEAVDQILAEFRTWLGELTGLADASYGALDRILSSQPHRLPMVCNPTSEDFERAHRAIAQAVTDLTLHNIGLTEARDHWQQLALVAGGDDTHNAPS